MQNLGRFVTICALLLGLVGGVSGAGEMSSARPEFPSDPNGGCKPGAKVTGACPVRMECFADSNYPKGGRCECNPLYVKKPAKLPFDDSSEWDDGFSAADCENHHWTHFVTTATYFVNILLCLALIHTTFVVLRELIRAKALKFNATGTSLVVLFIQSICMLFVSFIYFANMVGLDRNEYWYERRTILFTYCMFPCVTIVDFEIAATWLDLYDRTNKMKKSTSQTIKILRIVLRLIALLLAFGSIFITSLGGLVVMFLSLLGPLMIGFPFVGIGGWLITRTICPDRKDVANPNWKVAESIRRGVKTCLMTKVFELAGIAGLIMTNRHPQLGYFYGLITAYYIFGFLIRMWGWLHYLIFGSRKHLAAYASENASAYFGFSTIGLNKMTTTASSRMSAFSSRSSVA